MSTGTSTEMLTTLIAVRQVLDEAPLALTLPGGDEIRRERAAMVDQLENYILPRMVQIDAPLLVVVGGSTGAGKSTLVNTLIGEAVTRAGVLRPTTRSPVVVHHPEEAGWFGPERILPDLARTTSPSTDVGALHLVASDALPPGLAVLDAPDVDSVDEHNRQLAAELLAAADLWLFVTSAARYADQVPWDYLRAAAERSTAVAIVLDRTTPEAVDEVRGHLARMLTARGLRDSPLFTVPETEVSADGLLPSETVRSIREWLRELAGDPLARSGVIQQTLDGAIRQLAFRTHVVADAVEEQEAMSARLRADAEAAFDGAVASFDSAIGDGTLMRGEVLARWQDFVGAGELTRALEERAGRLRDRFLARVRCRQESPQSVGSAVEHGLQSLLVEHAERATERTAQSWDSTEAGRTLLAAHPALGRPTRDFAGRAERMVRDWQGDVLDMVRAQGADKRSTARVLATGVNALGVSLMVLVFSQTAGLTGAEVGVAGGTAVVAQKVLAAVFGDQAVRRLAERARHDLRVRAEELLDSERARFLDAMAGTEAQTGAAARIRDVARDLDDHRHGFA